MNSLRLEKAYRGYAAELTNEITLIEADCGRFYAPEKGQLKGRDATEKVRSNGITTKLVYGEISATNCDIYGGEAVMQGERVVGVCTSGGFGYATAKSLAFAYIDPDCADALEVVILGERCALHLLDEPARDPDNARQKV